MLPEKDEREVSAFSGKRVSRLGSLWLKHGSTGGWASKYACLKILNIVKSKETEPLRLGWAGLG